MHGGANGDGGSGDGTDAGQADEPNSDATNVTDIRVGAFRRETRELQGKVAALADTQDQLVQTLLRQYREWERAHPEQVLRGFHKLEMVRLGFVGGAGFERCHQQHRLPSLALFSYEGRETELDVDMYDDVARSEVQMCPAMERLRCEPIWRALRLPPCRLLLLEVQQGLGGGIIDLDVQAVLDDVYHAGGERVEPQDEASFARAAALVRKYEELEEQAAELRRQDRDEKEGDEP